MRIAPEGGANGLNDEGKPGTMSTIRQGVKKFRRELKEDPELAADLLSNKMGEQIDKYGDKLFAERGALQAMLADTPLVKNLDNPEYMKTLLDGKANLEELFAELGSTHFDKPDEFHPDADRILPGFRALINLPDLPGQVIRSLTKSEGMVKSN